MLSRGRKMTSMSAKTATCTSGKTTPGTGVVMMSGKRSKFLRNKVAQIDERKESAEERKGTSDRESMVSDTNY